MKTPFGCAGAATARLWGGGTGSVRLRSLCSFNDPPTALHMYGPRRRASAGSAPFFLASLCCSLPAAAGNGKTNTRHALKLADHGKQVIRARISLGTEHAHQALGRRACHLRQLLKSHGRVDIVT